MKRFTETGKWLDPWFRKLSPKLKLLWGYICDTCDPAGVFELDADMASMQIGEIIVDDDLRELETRLRKLPSGRMLIVNFIPFQYGELSTECRPHKVVFDAIKKHKLQYPINTLSEGVEYPTGLEKDKDKTGKGSAEGKTKDNLPTSERSKRIAILFSRKLTTEWNDKEIAAFKKISKQPDEDFDLVEEFYKSDYEFLRHDLLTFLNNFTGEVDKARKWKAGKLNGSHRPNSPVNPRVAGTANQGMSSQYRGVGRVEGSSPSGQPAD